MIEVLIETLRILEVEHAAAEAEVRDASAALETVNQRYHAAVTHLKGVEKVLLAHRDWVGMVQQQEHPKPAPALAPRASAV